MLKTFISAWLITRIYIIYFRCGCSGIPLESWRLDFSVMVLINRQVVFLVLGFSYLIVSYHLHLPPIAIDGYKTSFPTLGWLPPRTATLEICMLLTLILLLLRMSAIQNQNSESCLRLGVRYSEGWIDICVV